MLLLLLLLDILGGGGGGVLDVVGVFSSANPCWTDVILMVSSDMLGVVCGT